MDRPQYNGNKKVDNSMLKARMLCYGDLFPNYDDDRIMKIANTKRIGYKKFSNYLDLAESAARTKQNIGARFVIVDREKDYKLSSWINVRILSKIINNKLINNLDYIESSYDFGFEVQDVIVDSVMVDGKETRFYQLEDSVVFEADKNSRIVINNDPEIVFERNEFISNTVDYYGDTMEVRKQKISVEEYKGDECTDSVFPFIKYKITKDSKDEKENEFTIELIDDPSTEISVYEIFFNEDQNDVFFDPDHKKKYKVSYKNKESGRLVVRSDNGYKDINLNGKVYLNTNINQISRQRYAINTIVDRPSESQKVLLKLCDKREIGGLEKFDFIDEELDYKILTDVKREGTLKQREFVKKSLQTPDFMILQGPPGSGKTTAILELVYQLAKRGKKVLLCASTHVAVDNVLEKIVQNKDSKELLDIINPVRVGDEMNVYSDCVKEYVYSKIHEEVEDQFSSLVDESFNLVCGTTIGVLQFPLIDRLLSEKTAEGKKQATNSSIEPLFDYLILDEASKTTFSEFLVPAILCKKWIIVGDVKQLAPYVEKNDLIPTLLQCKPLSIKDERLALSFLKIYSNSRDKEKYKNYGFIFNPSAIKYIDSRVEPINNLVAITNARLSNIYTISKKEIEDNSYKVTALLSETSIFLIEEGLIDMVLPLLNERTKVLHSENDIRSSEYYGKYSILHARESFPVDYKKIYKDYSRKIEDEILWRLIRLYELDKKQHSSEKYQKYIEDVRSLLKETDVQAFDSTIDTLRNIAIPSIIMMLQEGINKNDEHQSILTAGLEERDKINRFVKLDYQHRMHKDISRISRENVYNNEALKDGSYWKSQMDYCNDKARFEVRNIEGPVVDGKNENEHEAKAIIDELVLFMDYIKDHKKTNGEEYTVAILSFYNGQIVNLRKKLKKLFNQERNNFNFYGDNIHVTLNTVDKFQGQEADVVYLSMVQNYRVGFLDSINRLNVSITRAKEKIIIFGDKKFFISQDHSEILNKLFKEVK